MTADTKYPKITVVLTPALAGKLDEYRDVFNISKICRFAIEQHINALSRAREGAKETMDQTIERLKAEKEQAGQEDYAFGVNMGYAHARRQSFQGLKHLINESDALETLTASLDWDRMGTDYDRLRNLPGFDEMESEEQNEYLDRADLDSAVQGFIAGVRKFWDDVSDKL